MRKRFAITIAALSFALLATQPGSSGVAPRARLVSVTEWNIAQPWFGGFSGIEVSSDGMRFTAVSDRSRVVKGRFERLREKLTGVSLSDVSALLDNKGKKFTGDYRDSEGLADLGNGAFLVSFEGEDRVERFAGLRFRGRPLPTSRAFAKMAENGAFEALAIDQKGVVYSIPEFAVGDQSTALIYSLSKGKWQQTAQISRKEKFKPVGADFGPDGRFYLLERSFNGWAFRSRVRRFDVEGGKFVNEIELLRTIAGMHDNLEGLAVWRDLKGKIRLTMISDDNFRLVQRTEIVEYVVKEAP